MEHCFGALNGHVFRRRPRRSSHDQPNDGRWKNTNTAYYPPIQTFLRVIVVSFVALILFAIPREGAAPPPLATRVIVGSGVGGQSQVRVFDGQPVLPSQTPLLSFTAFTQNPGGEVRVAGCDLNNDGINEIIAGTGLGRRAEVRVFDGVTGIAFPGPRGSFLAFENGFLGGVHLACGDVTGDNVPDIIAARAALGKPEVRVFNGVDATLVRSFFAFEQTFLGGVRVAACDLTPGDGKTDIIAARGPAGQPEVRAYNGGTGAQFLGPLGSFLAFNSSDRGGVYVACAGDLSGDTIPDIIAGKGLGNPPEVRVFSGVNAAQFRSFLAFNPTFAGGVRVASCRLNLDSTTDVLAGRGPGDKPEVRAFDGLLGVSTSAPLPLSPTFKGGVYVACSPKSVGGGPPPADTAPAVTSTIPTNGATGVTTNSNLTITFDEDVAVTGDWFQVSCPTSGPRNVTLANTVVTGGPTTWTINPNTDFAPNEICSTTIVAAQITDVDTSDPPDNMAADFTFGFTTEAAPSVSSTVPSNGATGVAVNTDITVTFSESVAITPSTFALECPAGTGVPFTLSPAPPGPGTSFTLNPNPDIPSGKACTVKVTASTVTDVDTNDPPDTMVADFTSTFSTVCSAVTVSPTTLVAGTAGQAYGPVTFTQTGGTGAITWSVVGALPAGMSLSTAGVLSGTPTQTGNFPVTIKATDAEGCTGEQAITLVINCPTITVSPASLPGGTIGSAYSQSVSQSGGVGTTTFAVTSGSLPSGLTLNSSSGAITGTPNGVGTFDFTITATDANGCTGVQAYSITIVCQPITVTPPAVTTGQMGVAFNQSFTQSGASAGAVFSLASGTLPTGLTLAANGTLSGIPTQSGSFPITVNVTDGPCSGTSAVYNLVIRPNAVDDTYPQTVIGNVSIDSGLIPFSAISNDQFTGTATITTFNSTSVQGGTVTMGTSGADIGKFTYNPPAGFEGADSFTYTLSAAGGTDTATVSFTVSGMVWFIDNSQASNGDGRLGSPFNNIANFNAGAADATGDNIFLYRQTATAYNGPLTLLNNERLIGQGATASLATITGLTVPTGSAPLPATGGTRPTVAHSATNLTVAQGNLLRGFDISNTGGTALVGTSFGTLTVSEVSVDNTNGIAINLNTGNPTASFIRVSANGGANGIVLNNTTGSFAVTGTGAAGTGGTIQNTTGRGASFISAQNISLTNMNFTNTASIDMDLDNSGLLTGDNLTTNAAIHLDTVFTATLNGIVINGSAEQGINGRNVKDFTLQNSAVQNSSITNAGNGADEDGIHFYNMLGTSSITNTTISSSGDDNINIQNNTPGAHCSPATCPPLPAGMTAVLNLTITNGSANTGVLGSGYLMGIRGTLTATVTIDGVTADNNFSGGIIFDTFDTSTSTLDIGTSTIQNNNNGIAASASQSADIKFDIHNNTVINNDFVPINFLEATGTTTSSLAQGYIRNNSNINAGFVSTATDGIFLQSQGSGRLTVAIQNNVVNYNGTQRAIIAQMGDGTPTLDFTATGNTVNISSVPSSSNFGIGTNGSVTGENVTACVDIGGAGVLANNFAHVSGGSFGAAGDIRVRRSSGTLGTYALAGYTAGNDVVAYLNLRNNELTSASSSGTFDTGPASCTQPVFP